MFTQKKVSKKPRPASRLDFIKLYAHFFIPSNKKVSKKYFCIFKELSTGATFGCREKGSSIIKMSRKFLSLTHSSSAPIFPTLTQKEPHTKSLQFHMRLYFSELFYNSFRNYFIKFGTFL